MGVIFTGEDEWLNEYDRTRMNKLRLYDPLKADRIAMYKKSALFRRPNDNEGPNNDNEEVKRTIVQFRQCKPLDNTNEWLSPGPIAGLLIILFIFVFWCVSQFY